MVRMFTRLFVVRVLAVVGLLALLAPSAEAQECKRPPCAFGSVDANGCCPGTAAPRRPAADTHCSGGKEISADTGGHCCWPGQVWGDGHCVGVPSQCPGNMILNVNNQACDLPACLQGQKRTSDGVHCCWGGQAWSTTRAICVGVPQCPKGYEREGAESCVSQDKDGDGIPNAVDQCPDQPEDFNHYKDEDGCPDEAERLQVLAAAQASAQAAANAEATRARQQADQARRVEEQARRAAAAAEDAKHKAAADAAAAEAARQQQAAREEFNARELSRSRRRTGGKVAIGLGSGFIAGAAIFMGLGAAENGTIHNTHFATLSDLQSANSSGQTYNSAAIAMGVIGAVGIVGGTTSRRRASSSPRRSVASG